VTGRSSEQETFLDFARRHETPALKTMVDAVASGDAA
jgi:hypothetical protein